MKLYTKVGDHGATKQINGKKVPKYDPQIVALGDLDELDSWLGYVAAQAQATPGLQKRCKHGSGNYMSCWRILRFRGTKRSQKHM